jgi:hypothetical protein
MGYTLGGCTVERESALDWGRVNTSSISLFSLFYNALSFQEIHVHKSYKGLGVSVYFSTLDNYSFGMY